MFTIFSGKTADAVWLKASRHLLSGKNVYDKPSRAGDTKELLHVGFSIADPRQRWVFSRVPPINIAFALAELIWIMNGRDDAGFLTFWNSQLPKYVGDKPHLHGAYGFRLRRHFRVDQLKRAYSILKSNPESRQVVLQIWDSNIDLPNTKGKPLSRDIPCNVISMLKTLNNRLEWCQVMRSNDIQLGTPYNIIQFTYLQEILAGWLGMELGSYNHISDSLHLYVNNFKDVEKAVPARYIKNIDTIALPYSDSERCFKELARRLDMLITDKSTEEKLIALASWPDSPTSFANILSVLAAETARKLRYKNLSEEIIENCHNLSLRYLWRQWANRFK